MVSFVSDLQCIVQENRFTVFGHKSTIVRLIRNYQALKIHLYLSCRGQDNCFKEQKGLMCNSII